MFGVSHTGTPVEWVRTHHTSTLCVWVYLNLNMSCPLLAQWDKAVGDNVVEGDLGRDMAPLLDTAPGQDLDRVRKVLALIDQGPQQVFLHQLDHPDIERDLFVKHPQDDDLPPLTRYSHSRLKATWGSGRFEHERSAKAVGMFQNPRLELGIIGFQDDAGSIRRGQRLTRGIFAD